MEIIGLGDDYKCYLMLIVFGWFSICGASYDYGDRDFLDFSTLCRQAVHVDCLLIRVGIYSADAGRHAL